MNRTTAAALLAALLLGGWLFLFERGEPGAGADGEPVFGMSAEQVASVSLLRPETPAVHLERRRGAAGGDEEGGTSAAFAIREGGGAPEDADPTEVDLLLQNIESLRFERRLSGAAALDLDAFGLAEPDLTVRVERRNARGPNANAVEAGFGAETPAPGNRYLRLGDAVVIVSDWSKENFDKSAWDLTDKRVFRFDTAGVRAVRISARGREAAIERRNGDWWIVRPYRFAADPYDASQLASKVREARMIGRARRDPAAAEPGADAPDPFGLAAPRLTARFEIAPDEDAGGEEPAAAAESASGETVGMPTPRTGVLHFGNPSDDPSGVFARIETDHGRSSGEEDAAVFVVAESLFDELAESVGDGLTGVRSVRLFRFSAWKVVELRLAGPEGESVFRREEGEDGGRTWTREPIGPRTGGAETTRAASDTMDDLLYRLNSTNAAAVTDSEALPAGTPAGTPAWTITVREEETPLPGPDPPPPARTETVRLAGGGEEGPQALRAGDERTLRLREADWEEITALLRSLDSPLETEGAPEGESDRDPEEGVPGP